MFLSEHIIALPENWCWTQADKVCSSVRDGTHVTPKYVDDGIPLVTSKNPLQDELNLTNTKMISAEDHKQISRRSAVENGDILFAMIGTVGNLVLVNTSVEFSIKNVGLFKKNPTGIMPTYFKYWLESKAFSNWLAPRLKGTTQKFAPLGLLRSLPVPLSPLNEQKRIVEKLEQLLSELDKAVDALKSAQQKLKTYRRAILKAAVEGELSSAWREENKAGLEPADELLRRILTERRRKWEEAELEKMRAKGKEPKDDKWKGKYKEPSSLTEDERPQIETFPELWVWVNLGQMIWFVKDGPHYSPTYSDSGIPFITGGHVRPNGVDFENAKYISSELHRELSIRCKPELNDILYTKGGTTGIARVNTYDQEFNVWVHVAVLKLAATDRTKPFFVQHMLNSPFCYSQSQKYTHGVGNQDLGLTRMINIVLPLPPEKEQDWIIAEIDKQSPVIDRMEEEINGQLLHSKILRQSILQKAFSVHLVPQNPNDEPANALLERIRAERETAGAKGKRGKKKTADDVQPRLLEVNA